MSTPAGWYPDPTGRHDHRWFNGDDWTDQVADGQTVSRDPVHGGGAPQQTPAAAAGETVSVPTAAQQPGAPAAQPGAAGSAPPPGAPAAQPGAAGSAPPPGAGAPVSDYVPPGSQVKSGKGKTLLIVAAVVVLIAVGVGVVLSLSGDDGDGDASDSDSSSSESDQSDDVDDDPSASDLFDDMGGDDSSGDPSSDEPADEPADEPTDGAYPPEEVEIFVGDCTGAGSDESFCRCVIDVLQRDVSFERYQEIDQEARTNPDAEVPPEVIDAVNECS